MPGLTGCNRPGREDRLNLTSRRGSRRHSHRDPETRRSGRTAFERVGQDRHAVGLELVMQRLGVIGAQRHQHAKPGRASLQVRARQRLPDPRNRRGLERHHPGRRSLGTLEAKLALVKARRALKVADLDGQEVRAQDVCHLNRPSSRVRTDAAMTCHHDSSTSRTHRPGSTRVPEPGHQLGKVRSQDGSTSQTLPVAALLHRQPHRRQLPLSVTRRVTQCQRCQWRGRFPPLPCPAPAVPVVVRLPANAADRRRGSAAAEPAFDRIDRTVLRKNRVPGFMNSRLSTSHRDASVNRCVPESTSPGETTSPASAACRPAIRSGAAHRTAAGIPRPHLNRLRWMARRP